jgi:hypothetical protein
MATQRGISLTDKNKGVGFEGSAHCEISIWRIELGQCPGLLGFSWY